MLQKKTKKRLSKTLAIYIYLFSSLISIITTSIQLYINYQAEMKVIKNSGEVLKKSYLESLKMAAWHFNETQLQALSNGISIYPNVNYVGVFMENKAYSEAGKRTKKNSILYQWGLSKNNNNIGTVLVEISTEEPLLSLFHSIKAILLTNLIKMFFIATFIILLVEYLITRHLKHLSQYLEQNQSLESLKSTIKLSSQHNSPNEIDSVVLAINQMRSKLKELWSQLQMSEQNYRQIINNSGQGVLITTNGKNIHCNKKALELFNIQSIDHFKQHLYTINNNIETHNKDLPSLPSMLEIIIPKQNSTHNEQKVIQHFFHNVLWSGEPSIVHFFIDITPLKKLEQKHRQQEAYMIQSDKMNSLGVMVSGITHEINNPNHLIRINIDTLSRLWEEICPILDAHHKKHPEWKLSNIPYSEIKLLLPVAMNDIKQGSIQIQNIITELKNFIRSNDSTSFNNYNIDTIIHDVLRILQPHISRKNIQVHYHPFQPNLELEARKTQLNQVFVNLILNAIQSCKTNTGKVVITANKVNENIVFTVEDNGYGIAPNHLHKIFDLFHSSKKEVGGTGIGLAIVFKLIQIHHGEIRVQSEVNNGSTFTISLPIKQPTPKIT